MQRRGLFLAPLAAFLLTATGCDRGAQFNNVDITGAQYAREFVLTDHTGARRTLADYKGKVVTVFFGFVQCPDICPTTLQDMAEVRRRLGRAGDDVQVLFITVDHERDTRDVLAKYVPAFDPSFVGLYGSPEDTARVAKEFKVIYEKVPGQTPTSYTINHSAGTYVFDRQGRVRLSMRNVDG